MKRVEYPKKEDWRSLARRPETESPEEICKVIFDEVARDGDRAVAKYSWYFDRVRLGYSPTSDLNDATDSPSSSDPLVPFRVSKQEIEEAADSVPPALKEAILLAKRNIEAFHKCQIKGGCELINENGFRCWQEERPIERVGIYIPGGSAPLFSSVLMLAIPAQLAGCREVVLFTPPGSEGRVNPTILWSAELCGVSTIYRVGGVQAIAAMTLGTESIAPVDKIFGPGNQFVTAAKQYAGRYGVAIDMPAGPSELMVIADETANPIFVAADLLSQAEHGTNSQVVLVTCNAELLEEVERELEIQLDKTPRKKIAKEALKSSIALLLNDRRECLDFINFYAPEHLMLSVGDYPEWIAEINNAGSVFLGNYSPESAGDYVSGTNHTLPTGGYARSYSGIGVDSFTKKISFQEITPEGLAYLGSAIEIMAEGEGLPAHKNAVTVRRGERGVPVFRARV